MRYALAACVIAAGCHGRPVSTEHSVPQAYRAPSAVAVSQEIVADARTPHDGWVRTAPAWVWVWVAPHLSPSGLPVPAYLTRMWLYDGAPPPVFQGD